jgi:hypothetical protein
LPRHFTEPGIAVPLRGDGVKEVVGFLDRRQSQSPLKYSEAFTSREHRGPVASLAAIIEIIFSGNILTDSFSKKYAESIKKHKKDRKNR